MEYMEIDMQSAALGGGRGLAHLREKKAEIDLVSSAPASDKHPSLPGRTAITSQSFERHSFETVSPGKADDDD